jgi:hypothetical protein
VAGFRLVNVQAVLHSLNAYGGYEDRQFKMTNRRLKGGDHFNFETRTLDANQLMVLSALRDQYHERRPGSNPRSTNTFYSFHGPRTEHVQSICENGIVATRSLDAGFFGSGCYSTLNIEYALRYARGDFDPHDKGRSGPSDGRYPIIMFAATVSMAYPLTPGIDYSTAAVGGGYSDYFGKPLKAGFDCHIVCVNEASGFQAVNRDQCEYAEVIIEQESQMLPVAVLWFEEL